MAGLGDLVTAGGQVIQDLFGSEGATAEANSYTSAAQLAEQNASLTATSTRIQETQMARQVSQTEGTQIADVAGAGFTESGSALDLLRSSAQQGALAKSLTNIQGAITENSYAAQAGAYRGAAASADENANANTVSAIASIGGALINNSQTLLSAGKSVVSGVSSLFSSAPEVGTAFSGAAGATEQATTDAFLNPDGAVDFASQLGGSATDQAIAGGSELSEGIASSGIGLDTSAIELGTDTAAAETGIGSAFGEISDAVGGALDDAASYLGLDGLADLGLDSMLGPAGLILAVGSFIPGVSDVLNTVTGAVTDAIGDVFDGIGSIFGSVICTAFYKQGFISRKTWLGDSYYAADCHPTTFRGYYIWGIPIANQIGKRKWVAYLLFPLFRPVILEMAAQIWLGKSKLHRRILLNILLALSFVVGSIALKLKRKSHAH